MSKFVSYSRLSSLALASRAVVLRDGRFPLLTRASRRQLLSTAAAYYDHLTSRSNCARRFSRRISSSASSAPQRCWHSPSTPESSVAATPDWTRHVASASESAARRRRTQMRQTRRRVSALVEAKTCHEQNMRASPFLWNLILKRSSICCFQCVRLTY